MKVLMATGGTGGHIYPALALAECITQDDGSTELFFVGSADRMEAKLIPDAGYPFMPIEVRGMNGNIFYKLKSLLMLNKAHHEMKLYLRQLKPDIVIGFGNYISVPVITAAHDLKIPTIIHEQNSFAGKANLLLGKKADRIVGCYPENMEQFPKEKTIIYGNPRASIAARVEKDESIYEQYGLSKDRHLVLIMMGSLGSSSVNSVLEEMLPHLKVADFDVLVATGNQHFDSFGVKSEGSVHIYPYVDGLKCLKACDLVVARGGATTAAEIAAMGKPSIIIPSPYVPNNHQVINAQSLQNSGASVMIEEKDLNAEVLEKTIRDLMEDDERRAEMAEHARESGYANASDDIINLMKELVVTR